MSDMEMAAHIEGTDALLDGWGDPAEMEYWMSQARCPACGDWIDYCQGHGDLGDPDGARILALHDDDDHSECHSMADCRFEDLAP